MTLLIQSTIPVLASLDIDETIAFYTERLGFVEELRTDDYAVITRDRAEIHFWLCSERRLAENTSCYIRVADTDRLFREFSAKGVAVQLPTVRPWGMKELYVIDMHGNLLKFGGLE